jgi:polysaccharide deacetylase family protein (PEP-CTERM system associated)
MLNILTIDIEDYFQVYAFSNVIKFEDWDKFECRIERNTDRILGILNEASQNSKLKPQNSKLDHSITHSLSNSLTQKVQATFFVLGWIAERYPGLVKRIQKEGHEIACHGYVHKLIYNQSKEEFRNDIRKAKAILEDITGDVVVGYRAPSYSITDKSKWAFDVLLEEGFKYDSSIFPIRHDYYGIPNAPRFPFIIFLNETQNVEFLVLNFELNTTQNSKLNINNSITHSLINSNSLIEFPLSTVKILGQNFPISGGGYFRLFPYPLIRKGLKSINEKENKPFIFYVHPWEFDVDQPRIKDAANLSKFRHYVNLDKTEEKFRRLLKEFNFSSIRDILELNNAFTH